MNRDRFIALAMILTMGLLMVGCSSVDSVNLVFIIYFFTIVVMVGIILIIIIWLSNRKK